MFVSTNIADLALLGFAALTFWAAVSDILHYTIPNRICLALVGLYPAYVVAAAQPVDWLPAIAIAGAVLAVGFGLFSVKLCGAGDAKFLAAVALWAGPLYALPFIVLTTLAGGAVALFMYLQHRFARAPSPSFVALGSADPDIGRQQMPYGAAIGIAGLYVAFTLMRIS
jgi:prepilin peptidase CpaA